MTAREFRQPTCSGLAARLGMHVKPPIRLSSSRSEHSGLLLTLP